MQTPKYTTKENLPLALLLMALAMLLFTTANTVVKYLGGVSTPSFQIVFFRNLIPTFTLVLYFKSQKELIPKINQQIIKDFFLRSLFSAAGLSCLFYAYITGNLADVTAISFTSPLFVSLFAISLLKEKLSPSRAVALIIGFLGVIIISKPSGDFWKGSASAFALFYASSAAYLMVTDRKLRHHYSGTESVYLFSLGCTLYTLIPTIFFWQTPNPLEWAALGIVGILGGSAQILIALAYRRANASAVAQTAYISVIIAAIYNYLLFDIPPSIHLILGSVCIIGAGIFIAIHEHRRIKNL